MSVPAGELLQEGMEALTRANLAELDRLCDAAADVRLPETAEERKLAQGNLRSLGHLIALTRRNLRLLRGAGSGVYGPAGN